MRAETSLRNAWVGAVRPDATVDHQGRTNPHRQILSRANTPTVMFTHQPSPTPAQLNQPVDPFAYLIAGDSATAPSDIGGDTRAMLGSARQMAFRYW